MAIIIGIIPARYASTRFPGKPLIRIGGVTMIERVYRQCLKSASLHKVIVATDDQRIFDHVVEFGGEAAMTSEDHKSGTDRCAEVVNLLSEHPDVIINIQGDEPFIDPAQIDLVAKGFESPEAKIVSLIKRIQSEEDIRNPNVVKAVRSPRGDALYFSRSPIPYRRNPGIEINYYKHIGIYGYRCVTLQEITQLPPGVLEEAESLEQLRWLEAGYPIRLVETTLETIAIDTPADLELVEKMMKS